MKQLHFMLTFAIFFFSIACESILEQEVTTEESKNLNGEWIVEAYMNNEDTFGPFIIIIQMTPYNDSISIKDNGNFWNFQVNAATDYSNVTFNSDLSVNELSEVGAKIKIFDGKITENDSIYFDIQFEDDETAYGITYKIKGQKFHRVPIIIL